MLKKNNNKETHMDIRLIEGREQNISSSFFVSYRYTCPTKESNTHQPVSGFQPVQIWIAWLEKSCRSSTLAGGLSVNTTWCQWPLVNGNIAEESQMYPQTLTRLYRSGTTAAFSQYRTRIVNWCQFSFSILGYLLDNLNIDYINVHNRWLIVFKEVGYSAFISFWLKKHTTDLYCL